MAAQRASGSRSENTSCRLAWSKALASGISFILSGSYVSAGGYLLSRLCTGSLRLGDAHAVRHLRDLGEVPGGDLLALGAERSTGASVVVSAVLIGFLLRCGSSLRGTRRRVPDGMETNRRLPWPW